MVLLLKVKQQTFEVPKIESQSDSFTFIDFLAIQWYETHDVKKKENYFNELFKYALPFITQTATKFTHSERDRQDLIAVLSQDVWRLLTKWCPDTKYGGSKFHYLMLHQLPNKAINEQKHFKKRYTCETDLNTNFNQTDIAVRDSALDNVNERDFVNKLLDKVDDVKTKQLLELICDDVPINDVLDDNGNIILPGIKTQVGKKALRAIRRRQEMCRPKVISLIYGSYTKFLNVLMQDIIDPVERNIIKGYCNGMGVQEIKSKYRLSTIIINECIDKYKPVIMKLLRG